MLSQRRVISFVMTCTICFGVSGCADMGYYTNTFGRLETKSTEPKPISVYLSSPQIFKREALINERRGEVDYLESKLKESETISFTPELLRDVEVVSSLAAQFGLSFDSGVKKQYDQVSQLSDLQNQISVVRLQEQLGQLQRDLQLMQASYASQTTPSALSSGSTSTVPVPSVSVHSLPELSSLTSRIKDLIERLDKTSSAPRSSVASSSPIDTFQDRQAYRRVLQSAINAVTLDDNHDSKGNSLFRMQFRATVLPSDEINDRFLGALNMRVAPPELSEKDLGSLYSAWLDHVTLRLNEVSSNGTIVRDPTLLTMGMMNKYFSIERFVVGERSINSKEGNFSSEPCFDLTPSLKEALVGEKNGCKGMGYLVAVSPWDREEQTKMDWQAIESRQGEKRPEDEKRLQRLGLKQFPASLEMFTTLERELDQIQKANNRLVGVVSRLSYLPVQLDQIVGLIEAIRKRQGGNINSQSEVKGEKAAASFRGVLCSGDPCKASGETYAYAVTPAELAQHLSTATRMGSATQVAASLSALLPAHGAGVSTALGYSRAAVGKIDTLERVPLIVGFSHASGKDKSKWKPDASVSDNGFFGWLLGPKVVIDPEKKQLLLQHELAPYDLTVDLVAPGWWPRFDVEYCGTWGITTTSNSMGARGETGIAAWPCDTGTETRNSTTEKRISRADLDGITGILLKNDDHPRLDLASITRVEPSVISGCSGKVTLLVEGSRVWRTQSAYIGGLQASAISVLPDMAGIAATFDISQLPQRPGQFVQPKLTLATPDGLAQTRLSIDGSRLAAKQCGDEAVVKASADDGAPVIKSISPATVYACDDKLRLLVQGRNLGDQETDKAIVYLGTIASDDKRTKYLGKDLEIIFDKPIGNTGGLQTTLPLIVTTSKGTTSKDVIIEREEECPSTQENTAAKSSLKVALKGLALIPTPLGRLDICAKKATLLLTGKSAMSIDGATMTLTRPKSVIVSAKSIKTVKEQNTAEINFVGLPVPGEIDSSSVDSSVQIQLYKKGQKVDMITVATACGGV